MLLTVPDSVLVTVMFTSGSEAPDGSVTVPTRVACWATALLERPRRMPRMGTVNRRNFHFRTDIWELTPISLKGFESDLNLILFSPAIDLNAGLRHVRPIA